MIDIFIVHDIKDVQRAPGVCLLSYEDEGKVLVFDTGVFQGLIECIQGYFYVEGNKFTRLHNAILHLMDLFPVMHGKVDFCLN